MSIRIFPVVFAFLIVGKAQAISLNVDFASGSFGSPSSSYVSPAGAQTSGYWNRAVVGTQNLRENSISFSGVLATLDHGGGQSVFGGYDYSNPNIVMSDAMIVTNPFIYSLTGLSDGQYDMFLYAFTDDLIFTNGGTSLVPVSITSLIGNIFTYEYSVDVNGGLLLGGALSGMNWVGIAGFQITNDPPPIPPVPAPPAALLMLTGLGVLGLVKRFRKADKEA